MPKLRVQFEWITGLKRRIFRNARLLGSWDGDGRYSSAWSTSAMTEVETDDGCPTWRADVELDASQTGGRFQWGVLVDSPLQTSVWGIPTEVADPGSKAQVCDFALRADGQIERYWLTH